MSFHDLSLESNLVSASTESTSLVSVDLTAENAPQKQSISKCLGDVRNWAQALAATYASRALHKAQGSIHRV